MTIDDVPNSFWFIAKSRVGGPPLSTTNRQANRTEESLIPTVQWYAPRHSVRSEWKVNRNIFPRRSLPNKDVFCKLEIVENITKFLPSSLLSRTIVRVSSGFRKGGIKTLSNRLLSTTAVPHGVRFKYNDNYARIQYTDGSAYEGRYTSSGRTGKGVTWYSSPRNIDSNKYYCPDILYAEGEYQSDSFIWGVISYRNGVKVRIKNNSSSGPSLRELVVAVTLPTGSAVEGLVQVKSDRMLHYSYWRWLKVYKAPPGSLCTLSIYLDSYSNSVTQLNGISLGMKLCDLRLLLYQKKILSLPPTWTFRIVNPLGRRVYSESHMTVDNCLASLNSACICSALKLIPDSPPLHGDRCAAIVIIPQQTAAFPRCVESFTSDVNVLRWAAFEGRSADVTAILRSNEKRRESLTKEGIRATAERKTVECRREEEVLQYHPMRGNHTLRTGGKVSITEYQTNSSGTGGTLSRINDRDSLGNTALHLASSQGHSSTIELLLSEGANTSLCNSQSELPIHVAARLGMAEAVTQLLANDQLLSSHIDTRNSKGQTPLHAALYNNKLNTALWLVENGSKVNTKDHQGFTSSQLALTKLPTISDYVRNRNTSEVRLLLEALYWGDEEHQTRIPLNNIVNPVLLTTLSKEDVYQRYLQLLLTGFGLVIEIFGNETIDRRTGTAVMNITQVSPLHEAAEYGFDHITELLCRCLLVQVDFTDQSGRTPLFNALRRNHFKCAMILLEYGANPVSRDYTGATPLQVGIRMGSTKACLMLIDWISPAEMYISDAVECSPALGCLYKSEKFCKKVFPKLLKHAPRYLPVMPPLLRTPLQQAVYSRGKIKKFSASHRSIPTPYLSAVVTAGEGKYKLTLLLSSLLDHDMSSKSAFNLPYPVSLIKEENKLIEASVISGNKWAFQLMLKTGWAPIGIQLDKSLLEVAYYCNKIVMFEVLLKAGVSLMAPCRILLDCKKVIFCNVIGLILCSQYSTSDEWISVVRNDLSKLSIWGLEEQSKDDTSPARVCEKLSEVYKSQFPFSWNGALSKVIRDMRWEEQYKLDGKNSASEKLQSLVKLGRTGFEHDHSSKRPLSIPSATLVQGTANLTRWCQHAKRQTYKSTVLKSQNRALQEKVFVKCVFAYMSAVDFHVSPSLTSNCLEACGNTLKNVVYSKPLFNAIQSLVTITTKIATKQPVGILTLSSAASAAAATNVSSDDRTTLPAVEIVNVLQGICNTHTNAFIIMMDSQLSTLIGSMSSGVCHLSCELSNAISPLVHTLCDRGLMSLCQRMLQKYPHTLKRDRNFDIKSGKTPLHHASTSGSASIVLQLLKGGTFDVGEQSYRDNLTALHYASMKGHVRSVSHLMQWGAGVDVVSTVFMAKRRECNVKVTDPRGVSPLTLAAKNGHTSVCDILIKRSARVDRQDTTNTTPLMWAAARGQLATVDLLLSRGASTQTVNEEGLTAVLCSVKSGHQQVCLSILRHDPTSWRHKNRYTNETIAHYAAARGLIRVLELLDAAKEESRRLMGNAARRLTSMTTVVDESKKEISSEVLDQSISLEVVNDKDHIDNNIETNGVVSDLLRAASVINSTNPSQFGQRFVMLQQVANVTDPNIAPLLSENPIKKIPSSGEEFTSARQLHIYAMKRTPESGEYSGLARLRKSIHSDEIITTSRSSCKAVDLLPSKPKNNIDTESFNPFKKLYNKAQQIESHSGDDYKYPYLGEVARVLGLCALEHRHSPALISITEQNEEVFCSHTSNTSFVHYNYHPYHYAEALGQGDACVFLRSQSSTAVDITFDPNIGNPGFKKRLKEDPTSSWDVQAVADGFPTTAVGFLYTKEIIEKLPVPSYGLKACLLSASESACQSVDDKPHLKSWIPNYYMEIERSLLRRSDHLCQNELLGSTSSTNSLALSVHLSNCFYAVKMGFCHSLTSRNKLIRNVDTPNSDGFTQLMVAVWYGHIDAVTVLLNFGAAVNHKCKFMVSANRPGSLHSLILSCMRGTQNTLITSMLLQRGSDPDIPDECGNTSAHHACLRGDVDTLKILLSPSSSSVMSSKNHVGETPYHIAMALRHISLVKVVTAWILVHPENNDQDNNYVRYPQNILSLTELSSWYHQAVNYNSKFDQLVSIPLIVSQGNLPCLVYAELCKVVGCTTSTVVLEQLKYFMWLEDVRELDFSGLLRELCKDIFCLIKVLHKLEVLDVSNNKLGFDTIILMCDAVRYHPSLRRICLDGNKLITRKAGFPLLRLLSTNTRLIEITCNNTCLEQPILSKLAYQGTQNIRQQAKDFSQETHTRRRSPKKKRVSDMKVIKKIKSGKQLGRKAACNT